MAQIEISEVVSHADRNAFIQFPWKVYKDDPAWVPPLILERKEFLDRKKHPFYLHGDAALFLARRNGEIVGRIMASDDPNYNSLHQTAVGCFGLFDCIDDREVAAALFEAAAQWLRERGRTEIMGPIDYSTNYVCGLLIDGFQHPPMLLTAHNPPYYRELIEEWGFEKVKDWYAWWFDDFRSRRSVCGKLPAHGRENAGSQFDQSICVTCPEKRNAFARFTTEPGKRTGVLFRLANLRPRTSRRK